MTILRPCDSWRQFEQRLENYLRMEMLARRRYIFRGHSDARWSLSTTLDRFVQQSGVSDPVAAQQMLLAEFAKEAVGIVDPRLATVERQMRLELLARHHGLPTTILDWTRSPYVAAFFAFGGLPASRAVELEKVAIWCLDLSLLDAGAAAGLAEVIEVLMIRSRSNPMPVPSSNRAFSCESTPALGRSKRWRAIT
jgi:hypothetical protein